MKRILKEAIDAGYFGLSIDILPFHRFRFYFLHVKYRMNGKFSGLSIPSQRATYFEYRELSEVMI